jgi:GntR family carbon starvation induced transcriptional regulator
MTSLPTAEVVATPPQTDTLRAYHHFRELILRGQLAPGTRLRLTHLARQLGLSAIPVREALNRLTREQLVEHEEQRGFAVSPAGSADFESLTLARIWTYEAALRDSIAHGNDAWEERVVLALHRLSRVPRYRMGEDNKRSINPDWDAPHKAFHQALISACRSDRMITLCADLFDHAVRYQHLARDRDYGAREDEHNAIARLVMDRQADAAVEALSAHLNRTHGLIAGPQSPSP